MTLFKPILSEHGDRALDFVGHCERVSDCLTMMMDFFGWIKSLLLKVWDYDVDESLSPKHQGQTC